LLLLLVTVFLASAQVSQRLYANPWAGFDFIDQAKLPTGQRKAAYCANLVINNTDDAGIFYFTADETAPNVKTGAFDFRHERNRSFSFWLDVVPPMTSGQAAPFVDLAVHADGDGMAGSAYPMPGNYQGLVLQTVSGMKNTNSSLWKVKTIYFPGYEFFTLVYGSRVGTGPTEYTEVYLAGWVNSDTAGAPGQRGFVVARGKVLTANPQILIDPTDISPPLFKEGCYDIFTSVSKPEIIIYTSTIFVVVPGRCQTFIRFKKPAPTQPFGGVQPEVFSPGEFGLDYIASYAFDLDGNNANFYYVMKSYNKPGSTLWYMQLTVKDFSGYKLAIPSLESDVQVVAGLENRGFYKVPFVHVILTNMYPGGGQVIKIEVGRNRTGDLDITGYANFPIELRHASSWAYASPDLYFVTYEPACKIARLRETSFCKQYCGDYGYCEYGICTCLTNYTQVTPGNPAAGCQPSSITRQITEEKRVVGTAAVMGVLWVITTIAAVFGWRQWYHQKINSPQASHLVQEYNRPL